MKNREIARVIAGLFAVIVSVTVLPGLSANAGTAAVISSVITANGDLNSADWYNPNDDLVSENGMLCFTEDSNQETRLISKTSVAADEYFDKFVEINATAQISKIQAGQSFIIAIGLSDIESMYGEAGSVEIQFKDNGGVTAEVVEYNENGDKSIVLKEQKCGSLNSKLKVRISISNAGQLELSINGRKLGTAKLSNIPEGLVGILQTEQCVVRVSEFAMQTFKYERPQNVNIFEDFESGSMNDNSLTSLLINYARVPACIEVQELNGSQVLRFKNAGLGFLGTKYSYSNFELSYDIPFFSRSDVMDEYGSTVEKKGGEYGVSFGDLIADAKGETYITSTDLILFTEEHVSGYLNGGWKCDLTNQNFWNPDSNEGYSVKIKMEDSTLTLYMKALSADKWQKMASHTYTNYKSGYIKIWSTRDTNFAIDNFKITNLDHNPNLLEDKFVSAKVEVKDFDYSPEEMVFKPIEEEPVFNWMTIVPYAAITGTVLVVIGVIVNCILRKKGKKSNFVKEVK